MSLRKLYIAIDCASEEERDAVQRVLEEVSNMRVLTGSSIVRMYPMFQQKRRELTELFRMIAEGGVKSLLSMRGAQIINKLR